MASVKEFEDELEGHAVHVGHGEDGERVGTGLDMVASDDRHRKLIVAPEGTVGNHHTLGEARGARGVVDEGQFVGALLGVVADVLLAEILGELVAVHLVEVLARVREFIGTRDHQGIVGDVDDAFQGGHLGRVDGGSHHVAHEEQFGLGVVHDVVNLVGGELVEDRHGYGSVGECGEEGRCPVGRVASAEGNLVTLHDTTVLEHNVELLDLACHIVILQGGPFIVSQRIQVPILGDTLLYKLVKTRYFHIS